MDIEDYHSDIEGFTVFNTDLDILCTLPKCVYLIASV